MIIKVNPDKDFVEKFRKKLDETDGYCPCRTVRNDDTICPCKDFREQETPGSCHCGLFMKVEKEKGEKI